MSAEQNYSLADLVRVTGAPRRRLQVWADAGAIKVEPGTDRGGPGRHRLFPQSEAAVARILNNFAERQFGIGTLIRIGSAARLAISQASTEEHRLRYMVAASPDPDSWTVSFCDGGQHLGRLMHEGSDGGGLATAMLNPMA